MKVHVKMFRQKSGCLWPALFLELVTTFLHTAVHCGGIYVRGALPNIMKKTEKTLVAFDMSVGLPLPV